MSTSTNLFMWPVISLVRTCQEIVQKGSALMGPSKADTIAALKDTVCTEHAKQAIKNAEWHVAREVKKAQAAMLPALEAAENKLAQLRKNYDGLMGMSIDADLVKLREALQLAREAAR